MKGTPDEEAVLCTTKATFALKHVETTNSLFIVPGPLQNGAAEGGNVVVAATADAHIELVPTAPRFAALDRVLEVSFHDVPDTWCFQLLLRTCSRMSLNPRRTLHTHPVVSFFACMHRLYNPGNQQGSDPNHGFRQATKVEAEDMDEEPGPSGRRSAHQPHTFDELLDLTQVRPAKMTILYLATNVPGYGCAMLWTFSCRPCCPCSPGQCGQL